MALLREDDADFAMMIRFVRDQITNEYPWTATHAGDLTFFDSVVKHLRHHLR